MARPDERVPLGALIIQLDTVRGRMITARDKLIRHGKREGELVEMVAAERDRVTDELAAADAQIKTAAKGAK